MFLLFYGLDSSIFIESFEKRRVEKDAESEKILVARVKANAKIILANDKLLEKHQTKKDNKALLDCKKSFESDLGISKDSEEEKRVKQIVLNKLSHKELCQIAKTNELIGYSKRKSRS